MQINEGLRIITCYIFNQTQSKDTVLTSLTSKKQFDFLYTVLQYMYLKWKPFTWAFDTFNISDHIHCAFNNPSNNAFLGKKFLKISKSIYLCSIQICKFWHLHAHLKQTFFFIMHSIWEEYTIKPEYLLRHGCPQRKFQGGARFWNKCVL